MGLKLALSSVDKSFQKNLPVFSNLSLEVEAGSSLAVLGPSGCGKTTLLMMVAGLLKADAGRILIGDKPVDGPRRDCGVILQSYGLMPWKNLLSNVAFGLTLRSEPRARAYEQARHFIEQVGLAGKEKHYPSQLSGGQRQRAALARALSLNLELLLMDEPLSALDVALRKEMQALLKKMHKEYGYTQMVVTHSPEEALYLGEKIVVLSAAPAHILSIFDNPFQGRDEQDICSASSDKGTASSEGRELHDYTRLKSSIIDLLYKGGRHD